MKNKILKRSRHIGRGVGAEVWHIKGWSLLLGTHSYLKIIYLLVQMWWETETKIYLVLTCRGFLFMAHTYCWQTAKFQRLEWCSWQGILQLSSMFDKRDLSSHSCTAWEELGLCFSQKCSNEMLQNVYFDSLTWPISNLTWVSAVCRWISASKAWRSWSAPLFRALWSLVL